MSDNQNDRRDVPEKRKLSMTLGLGFALGVAAFGISDAFLSDNESGLSTGEQEQQATEFTCSMHPQIRQPEMGPCPLVWYGPYYCELRRRFGTRAEHGILV